MEIDELRENLELFLNKGAYEKVLPRLDVFKEDTWLIVYLNSQMKGKEMRNLTPETFIPTILAINGVVMPNYPIQEPIQYHSLYRRATESGELPVYNKILSHLEDISKIEKTLLTQGIGKNDNFGQRKSNSTEIDQRPYLITDSSYIMNMYHLLSEDSATRQNMVSLDKRLQGFKVHLQMAKEAGLNLPMLFSNGYGGVIKTLDSTKNKKDADDFSDASAKVIDLIKKLDSLGINMNHKLSIAKVNDWVTEKKLTNFNHLLDYLNQETMMYISGLHLKNN